MAEKPIFLKSPTHWVFGFYWGLGFIGYFCTLFAQVVAQAVGKLVG